MTFPAGGGAVGFEGAELVEPESARWRNAIENVRVGVRDAFYADPDLQAAVAGSYIDLSLVTGRLRLTPSPSHRP